MAAKTLIGVIGLGKFGYQFGKTLVELGWKVIGIDSDANNVKKAQQVFSQVYQADATNKDALAQMAVGDLSHVLVSVGESIAASSMISLYLKEFGVPRVWVKAINSDHEKLLRKIGVDEVIIPEHMAAKQLANRIAIPGFIEHLPFDTDMVLEELIVKKWAGMKLRDIRLTSRYDVQVIAIKKTGSGKYKFVPRADDQLDTGDIVVVIGHTDRLPELDP